VRDTKRLARTRTLCIFFFFQLFSFSLLFWSLSACVRARACALWCCTREAIVHNKARASDIKTATGDKGDHFYTVLVKNKASEGLSRIDGTGRLGVPIHNYYWYQ
jgi:hypothetical protein